MRKETISWKAKDEDYENVVCPNFLMACKFEGFDHEQMNKDLTPLLAPLKIDK